MDAPGPDIFAVTGVVLLEMATGKKAFEGKSQASLMAKILETDPAPMSALAPMTPPSLDRIVKRCLAKDPDDRWQSARDIEAELKWIADGGSQTATANGAAAPRTFDSRTLRLIVAGALFAALVSGLVVWFFKPAPAAPKIVSRFSIVLAPGQLSGVGVVPGGTLAISPDGTRIVYSQVRSGGPPEMYLRAISSLEALPIPGTENSTDPFFSPDGQWLGFWSSGALKKVSLNGGGFEHSGLFFGQRSGELDDAGQDSRGVWFRPSGATVRTWRESAAFVSARERRNRRLRSHLASEWEGSGLRQRCWERHRRFKGLRSLRRRR